MSKRIKSEIWDHMEKIHANVIKCKLCSKEFSYSGGTTTLSRHLYTTHQKVMSFTNTQSMIKEAVTPIQPKLMFNKCRFSQVRQEKATQLLTKFIILNMLPLSLVDDAAFADFVNLLEPEYKIPCRQTFTDRLDSMKHEEAKSVKEEMGKASSVAVTTDIWTSAGNASYISLTASYITSDWQLITRTLSNQPIEERHTQANISARLKDMTKMWAIDKKTIAVVHDGAANMKETGSNNNWFDVSCANHKLHLAVTGSMGVNKVIKTQLSMCVAAASRLVGHFSHSPLANTEMQARQSSMGISGDNAKPLKLVQHVITRWNSIYDMFERLMKLRWPVVAVLSDRSFVKAADAKELDMGEENWQLMKDLLPVLQPLQIVTALLSAEKMPSSSTVYPLIVKLLTLQLVVKPSDTLTIQTFKNDLRSALVDRFQLDDPSTPNNPFIVASVLDPATKNLDMFDVEFRKKAYDNVRKMFSSKIENTSNQPPIQLPSTPTSVATMPPLKDSRSATLSFLGLPITIDVPDISQFDRYLSTPASGDVDPLVWWSENSKIFPSVASIAARYLAIPATSVMSERQFSAAGRLVTKMRTRLDPKRVDTIMFLYKNV